MDWRDSAPWFEKLLREGGGRWKWRKRERGREGVGEGKGGGGRDRRWEVLFLFSKSLSEDDKPANFI